jgi:hypothetical protein
MVRGATTWGALSGELVQDVGSDGYRSKRPTFFLFFLGLW